MRKRTDTYERIAAEAGAFLVDMTHAAKHPDSQHIAALRAADNVGSLKGYTDEQVGLADAVARRLISLEDSIEALESRVNALEYAARRDEY